MGSKAHCGACFQMSLIGVCLIRDPIVVVFMTILYPLSSKNMMWAVGDLEHA